MFIQELRRKAVLFPEEVVELQTRIEFIYRRTVDAVAQNDFGKAREYSEEEAREREKLQKLYQQHGLLDWLYD